MPDTQSTAGVNVLFPVGTPVNKTILIGTRNKAKIEMIKKSFPSIASLKLVSLNDIPKVDDSALTEGADYKENARKKSEFYFSKTGIPTISTDHILWLEKWSKNRGFVTHVREEFCGADKANDEEVMRSVEKFVRENGASKMNFYFATSFTDEHGTFDFVSVGNEHILQGKRSKKVRTGYPLDSYIIDSRSGKYLVEQDDSDSYEVTARDIRTKLMPVIFGGLEKIEN